MTDAKPIRLFRPHRYYEGEPDVIDVYPVGFYSDVRRLLMALRMGHWWDISYQVRRIARSWRRRSYWNGYLAEVGHPVALCGHGWTRRRALLSLEAARLQERPEDGYDRGVQLATQYERILTDLIAELRHRHTPYRVCMECDDWYAGCEDHEHITVCLWCCTSHGYHSMDCADNHTGTTLAEHCVTVGMADRAEARLREATEAKTWTGERKVTRWTGTHYDTREVSVSDDLKATGKVVILRDSDRVVDKWTLRLMYAVVFASALSGVLRLIAWVMER